MYHNSMNLDKRSGLKIANLSGGIDGNIGKQTIEYPLLKLMRNLMII